MTDPLPRPVPRFFHVWAIVAVLATFVLLAIGQLVTSFGAGMADPVWPTEPWYVFRTATDAEKARFKEDFGFFVEHSHRIAGWTVGGLVIVLAVGLLWTDPRPAARWTALAGLVVLVVGYGDFHKGLMAQKNVPPREVVLPAIPMWTAILGAAVMIVRTASGLFAGVPGSGLRVLGALALVAVMIQGLLGGFRVKLNELVGTDLAAFHGMFAQVVFGLLAMIAAYTARPAPVAGDPVEARRLQRWANGLAHLIFVQVVFGALVRHYPEPLTQRLHFVTAFVATAAAVLVLRAVFAGGTRGEYRERDGAYHWDSTAGGARRRAGWAAWALAALIALQLYLGVEAWMAKFGTYQPPFLVKTTPLTGAVRTLHALVGSAVWAVSLVLAIRLRSAAPPAHTLERTEPAGEVSGDAK